MFAICRMSAEDLEIHLPLKGSQGEGREGFLLRGKGILRGCSLPSLLDGASLPHEEEEEDASPEENIININQKEQEMSLLKVAVEHNY